MCEEKKSKICLIKAGNAVNSGTMDKFSPAPYGGLPSEMWSIFPQGTTVSGNEKQADFALFNLSAVGT